MAQPGECIFCLKAVTDIPVFFTGCCEETCHLIFATNQPIFTSCCQEPCHLICATHWKKASSIPLLSLLRTIPWARRVSILPGTSHQRTHFHPLLSTNLSCDLCHHLEQASSIPPLSLLPTSPSHVNP